MYLGLVIIFEMYVLKMILTSIAYIVSIGKMNITIIGKWSESVSDEDKRLGMQVLELCIERDSFNEWVFDRGEIFDIIIFVVSYSKHVFMYIILLNYSNVLAISMNV